MKSYDSFISESLGIPELNKALKKRFKGTKDVKSTNKKTKMRGSIIGAVTIPKVKGSDVEKFLKGLGYKTGENFDGFIDMYRQDGTSNYKVNIVSMSGKDVEVRLSTHIKGKSHRSFHKGIATPKDYDQGNRFGNL